MMAGKLLLIAVLALAAQWTGFHVGCGDGYAEAMRWRERVDRMSELFETDRFDEAGNSRLEAFPVSSSRWTLAAQAQLRKGETNPTRRPHSLVISLPEAYSSRSSLALAASNSA